MSQYIEAGYPLVIALVVFLCALWVLYKIHLSNMDERTRRMIKESQIDISDHTKIGGFTPDDIE